MSSTETSLSAEEREILLAVAEASIRHGLAADRPLAPATADYPEVLRSIRATFVTLHRHNALRGCIGTLEARHPLVEDVARNAYAAAFEDPRFPPLAMQELEGLEIHISVLSPSEPVAVASEEELLAQLRPGVDGLILEDRGYRGTFLPSVWESLPRPGDFLRHLKAKAGLSPAHWSDTLRVRRYTTESFGRPIVD